LVAEAEPVTANVKRVPMGAGGVQGLFSEVSGFAPEAKSYLARGRPKDARQYTPKTGEYTPKSSRYVFFFFQFSDHSRSPKQSRKDRSCM